MPRVTDESFPEGTELVRVYLAGSVAEAEKVERVLEELGATWVAEPETYAARNLLGFGSERKGVGIWIETDALDRCADALEQARLVAGLVER
ncbi:MAG: hypothetical protein QM767_08955 [Anaeromyxobacter sp.]